MSPNPALLVFCKATAEGVLERYLRSVQRAVALDWVCSASASGAFEQCLLVTDQPELFGPLDPTIIVERVEQPFHLGAELLRLIERHSLERLVYVGGGGLPLLPLDRLIEIAERLVRSQNVVITNNLFSSDLIAFTPADALRNITLPASDNRLAQQLRLEAGLEPIELERTAATQFDLDTPTDLLILKLQGSASPRARASLDRLVLDAGVLAAATGHLTNVQSEVLLAGRVGGWAWPEIERNSACRIRVFSEERGMRADGREERGEARSVLGLLYEQLGPRRFFSTLADFGQAVFLDSRVLWAHLGWRPSAEDRFASDWRRPDLIQHTGLREFTEAATAAPLPVVLGAHSLVSGGLVSLLEWAWEQADGPDRSAAPRRP